MRPDPDPLKVVEDASQSIRVLNHITKGPKAFNEPSEVFLVLASLSEMACSLPQLLDQLQRWLATEQTNGRLYDYLGGEIGPAMVDITGHLSRTASAAQAFAGSAHRASDQVARLSQHAPPPLPD